MQGVKCRYNNTYAIEKAFNYEDFPRNRMNKNATVVGKKYISEFMTFDIETSKYYDEAKDQHRGFMYCWQACINDVVLIDRTWNTFFKLLEELKNFYQLKEGKKDKRGIERNSRKFVIYVHNLSFEFQFLFNFFNKDDLDIFAIDSHKVLKFTLWGIFEFRCSYYLSNMNLSKFIENQPFTTHFKMVEDLDYNILRTPKTKMSMIELGYCYNDVKGLHEAIEGMLINEGVNLSTIPMTSTGFVRVSCRNAMRKAKNWRSKFQKSALNMEQYQLCKDCLRGGNTHGNRYFIGEILENVSSVDETSAYPYVMMSKKYPSGPLMKASVSNMEMLENYNKKYCTMGRYLFTNVKLKRGVPVPYLSVSNCQAINDYSQFNGRVINASQIYVALTNIDFDIIKSQYDYDELSIRDFHIAYKQALPIEFRRVIFDFYEKKTNLKNITSKIYEYNKSKNKLNALYGLCACDIIRNAWEIDDTGEWRQGDSKRTLEQYYESYNNFLPYQWAPFITSYARQHLQKSIDKIGLDTIYCDTDSNKYINNHDKDIEELNAEVMKEITALDLPPIINKNGKIYAMGVFDREPSYDYFITLGAKKYAYEQKGKIGVTVSGLNKKQGAKELAEYGGLKAFRIGTTFYNSGRTIAYYNNEKPHTIEINGESIYTSGDIAILDTTYKLGLSNTMLSFLEDLEED